jgi:Flp pilus assembly protein TadD
MKPVANELLSLARAVSVAGTMLCLSACSAGSGDDAIRQEQVAKDPGAMVRIAEAAESSGDLASAAAFYHRAAELQPDLPAAQIGEGRVLALQGDVDQALDTLRAAHGLNPRDGELTKTLGRLLIATGHPEEAVRVFQQGLDSDPSSAAMLVDKGVALDKSGRHSDAQLAYQAALRINPNDAAARGNINVSRSLASGLAGAAGASLPSRPDAS